jgi:hypothetical protein
MREYEEYSVAFTDDIDRQLTAHLNKGPRQEDLCFALWRPSLGQNRCTAIIREILWPREGDRILQGNVLFTSAYLRRALHALKPGDGLALLHSHLGPGWQDMSDDDIVAERDRVAGPAFGRSGLPLLGLTWGNDGAWSGRFWIRTERNTYIRRWARSVRVVGPHLAQTFHPELAPANQPNEAQVATASVWGSAAQANITRTHIGIIGVGSVGSVVAEALARIGVGRITVIDFDIVKERNRDRTLNATVEDAKRREKKVTVAVRGMEQSHTADPFTATACDKTLLCEEGFERALDCDVLVSCVDRPLPRHMLNAVAYAHLLPVVDGGILARTSDEGKLLHATWRIHTAGPGQRCLACMGAITLAEIALDREGKLDDPEYIKGLPPEFRSSIARQNVLAFSLSVAAHEVLQILGLVTGMDRVGGIGPQTYHSYPGRMDVQPRAQCDAGCSYAALTSSAADLTGNFLGSIPK